MGRTLTYFAYNSRVGSVTIGASDSGITMLAFGDVAIEGAQRKPCALTNDAATQVQEYFAGKREQLDVPLDIDGSAFARTVWDEIRAIPYGMTATAGQIAERIGKPRSLRSVGIAISSAPVELIIPTHRIVLANGRTRGVGKAAERHAHLAAFERAQREKSQQKPAGDQ